MSRVHRFASWGTSEVPERRVQDKVEDIPGVSEEMDSLAAVGDTEAENDAILEEGKESISR